MWVKFREAIGPHGENGHFAAGTKCVHVDRCDDIFVNFQFAQILKIAAHVASYPLHVVVVHVQVHDLLGKFLRNARQI